MHAPSTSKCGVTARLSVATFPPAGGSGAVSVAGNRDCTWTVTGEPDWLTIEGSRSGNGDGQVAFRVAANATPVSRRGALSIAETSLEVTQQGAPCHFALDRTDFPIAAAGGTVVVRATAMTGCQWTAQSRDAWIRIAGAASGNGSGAVSLVVAPNSDGARTGTVVVADQGVIVRQAAAVEPPPAPTPTPTPAPPAPPAPTPTPTPPPTPPPTPTPPPAPPTSIELSGELSSLAGTCPDVTLTLGGYTVQMNAATEYRRGNCGHLADRLRIDVTGRLSDGRVTGTRVTLYRRD